MQFKVGYGTDVGRKRNQNQDNFAAVPEIGLFVVADGMGGHRGGEIASAMVIDVVPDFVTNALRNPEWDPKTVLIEALRAANQAIFKRSSEQQELHGMGRPPRRSFSKRAPWPSVMSGTVAAITSPPAPSGRPLATIRWCRKNAGGPYYARTG